MKWTASLLAFVLPLKPEDVLAPDGARDAAERRVEAKWIDLAQRLVWTYGFDAALARLNGEDASLGLAA